MLVVTNPNNKNETYTYGKRGRKPLWVQEAEDKNLWEVPMTALEKNANKNSNDNRPEGSLRIWKWRGGNEEETPSNIRCFIVSASEAEAIRYCRSYFIHGITGRELTSLWKEVKEDLSDCFPMNKNGIWFFNENDMEWQHRKKIK